MRRAVGSPYEVRCPRCDVSFPVEQKRCIHCGGPVGKPGRVEAATHTAPAPESSDAFGTRPAEHEGMMPIEPEESPFLSTFSDDDQGETTESRSAFGSLLRSFGTIIWIVLLIAFSLAQNCFGE